MPNIKIGKNAIENLTIGMYRDSRIIYREYIQNAADSIDFALKDEIYEQDEKPEIEIELDDVKRVIRIKDNAYGVKESEIYEKLANVADSDKKQGVNKGFRGIGRLGGLAYCETLTFITTSPGEMVETTMTWDANKLINMINDPAVKDSAEDLLSKVISYSSKPCDSEAHYFIVELEHIRDENSELLDTGLVKRYISANAPVDYNSTFFLKSEIKNFISENHLNFSEYRIFVNGEDVFKEYNYILYDKSGQYDEIESLHFKEFRNNKNELLAWMWFGVSDFNKKIPKDYNEMLGIRLRKDNIQVGNENTLANFFSEDRGNYYFIGELHAVHKNLVPNARRDYFNENPTRVEFETEITKYFKFLKDIYYGANRAKSALNKENRLIERQNERAEKEKTGFISEEDSESLDTKIAIAKVDFEKAQKEFDKLKENSKKNNPLLFKIVCSIEVKHKSKLPPISSGNPIPSEKDESSNNTPTPSEKDESSNNTPTPSEKDESSNNTPTPSEKDESSDNTPTKTPLLTDNLIYLNEAERKLIGRVYKVIQNVLPPSLGPNLIQKIQNELNSNES